MWPFDWLGQPAPVADERLGALTYRSGRWHGTAALAELGDVPVEVAGSRRRPDPVGLAAAHVLAARFPALRPAIAAALLEHREPYLDAADAPDRCVSPSASPAFDVWQHVRVVKVRIEPTGGVQTVELALDVDWDEEHTLGARIQNWRLVELNGSIV